MAMIHWTSLCYVDLAIRGKAAPHPKLHQTLNTGSTLHTLRVFGLSAPWRSQGRRSFPVK